MCDMDLNLFRARIPAGLPADACWPWEGATDRRGYGLWSVKGAGVRRTHVASRLAYELHSGETIPEGLSVCHTCDNPPCCNPAHLWLGTALDNARDKMAKGRLRHGDASGTKNGHALLDWTKVDDIRRRVAEGPRGTSSALAREYGVAPQTICNVVKGRAWMRR